ncbi:MAG: AgmX/PglI C-terminal domain-containing protein [Bradymonadaceae bacterium]
MLAWGIGAIVAAVGGCATSTTPDKTDSKSTESETSSSDSASQLETVSDQSSRNGREQARVADTIDRHVDKLESCYIRGALVAENPDLTGELTFGWTIDDQGRPHHVHLLDDQLGHQEIATCIQTILDGLTFTPPESDSLEVQYPFQFDRASNIPHEDWYCRVHRSLETTWSPPENLDAERLRQLARQTVVYAQLTDEGAIRQVEFLRRPD